MVVGKPYIHFKINNEPIEEVVDYNYTWATTVEAKKGRSYVYNGNIYACEKSCYSKIPYIGSEYYTLIQEAPATRFDAVIPLVFLDDAYGSTAPVGTLIANGNGARSDHFIIMKYHLIMILHHISYSVLRGQVCL